MLFLDLETLDWFDSPRIAHLPRAAQLAAMRFAVATTYSDADGWSQWWAPGLTSPTAERVILDSRGVFTSQAPGRVTDLWRALVDQTVVGWNIFDFDLPYLMFQVKFANPTCDPWLDPMRVIDLMDLCKRASKPYGRERWYKLQDVSVATLGRGKDGDGKQAAQDLASGDLNLMAQAARYCRSDVQLVIDLFAAAQDGGLLLPARPARGEQGDLRLWLSADGTIRDVRREE